MRLCWIDVYIGLPDVITHDAEKKFRAFIFKTSALLLHIETMYATIESPKSMSFVE